MLGVLGRTVRMVVVIFTLIVAPKAHSEPIRLACDGEMDSLRHGDLGKETLSLAIDLRAGGTVTVEGYEPVGIFGDYAGERVEFMSESGSGEGVSAGSINRITGAASILIVTRADVHRFYGICRPAKRVF
jgi:hypothetical protein